MATIAEVLHYAADHCLMHPKGRTGDGYFYSCSAVQNASETLQVDSDNIFKGLENMGLNPYSGHLFDDVKDPQGARYAWLKFAALIAEEQGV